MRSDGIVTFLYRRRFVFFVFGVHREPHMTHSLWLRCPFISRRAVRDMMDETKTLYFLHLISSQPADSHFTHTAIVSPFLSWFLHMNRRRLQRLELLMLFVYMQFRSHSIANKGLEFSLLKSTLAITVSC